ncbi:MAG: hypothetical protein ACPGSC_07660 [Granulosicoccaceae bacterium]
MTFLSKQGPKPSNGKFDLTRYSDLDLHSLMDAVQSEMARRASVNAKRRALVRKLESLAQAEGVTLDEVRQYLKGDTRIYAYTDEETQEAQEAEVASIVEEAQEPQQQEKEPKFERPFSMPFSSPDKHNKRDREFESFMQKELG